jgi:pyruvate,orthophosphate dikinase
MTVRLGEWTLGLEGGEPPARELIGGKAWSVARMSALGLQTPPAFVVTTRACAAYLSGGELPQGLEDEISAGVAWLESTTQRQFGRGPSPLLVSVRSGAPISMPGMMDTVLNLGINETTEAHLSAECGDPTFARDVHRRFLDLYGRIVLKTGEIELHPDGGRRVGAQHWRPRPARRFPPMSGSS